MEFLERCIKVSFKVSKVPLPPKKYDCEFYLLLIIKIVNNSKIVQLLKKIVITLL